MKHNLVLTGNAAREFHEYEKDPYYSVRGLKAWYQLRVRAGKRIKQANWISVAEAKRRLLVLETLDDAMVIRKSEFKRYFG